jgi:putative autoinducer-2 (AI-2) aldolase
MPEADTTKTEKNFYTDVPQRSDVFFLKGSNSYDWGMNARF